MENNRQDWKKNLRSEFESYKESAPEGLWEALAEDLKARGIKAGGAVKSPEGRRSIWRAAWLPYTAIAAGLAAIAIVFLLPLHRTEVTLVRESGITAMTEQEPESTGLRQPSDSAFTETREGDTRLEKPTARKEEEAARRDIAAEPAGMSYDDSAEQPKEAGGETAETPAATQESDPVKTAPAQDNNPAPARGKEVLEFDDADLFIADASGIKGRRDRRKLSLMLAYSGMGSTGSSTTGYDALYGSSIAATRLSPDSGAFLNEPYNAVLMSNVHQTVNTERRHYQPISLGLRVGWEFAEGLSLVSGLEYSCLVSDLSSGTEGNRYETRQTLHYIGLPLSLEWSFVNSGRLRAYLSAGGQMSKALYGSSTTNFIFDESNSQENGLAMPQTLRITEDALQWSANIGAGIEYGIGDNLGLYIEPAASYSFDNGSPVENYYKSKPFSFRLALGLRIRLH